MHVLKRVALAIISSLFITLLFLTAFDIGFIKTATDPATVEKLVSESGIYSSVIPSALQQAKAISTSYGDIPASDPIIQNAAKAAIPPAYIQQSTELVIDNVYDWLNGKIAKPNFSVDLSGVKTLFANNIADATQKRLNGLPVCSLAQSRAIAASGSFDAYNAPCLPRGISPATIAEQVKSGVLSNSKFLGDIKVSAADLKNGDSNQSVFDQKGVKNIPKLYQWAKRSPAILIILTFLCGLGIVFLSRSRLAGLKHVGVDLAVIGVVMLIFAWAFNKAVNTQLAPKIKVDNAVMQQDIRKLVTDLSGQVGNNYRLIGGLYILLGVAGVAGVEVWRRRSTKPPLAKSPPPPSDQTGKKT